MNVRLTPFLLIGLVSISCAEPAPPAPDVPTPSPGAIGGVQTSPITPGSQGSSDIEDAIGALDAACSPAGGPPGTPFSDALADLGIDVVNLQPVPHLLPGGAAVLEVGAHDHDTIAVNLSELSPGAPLASALYHEFLHAQSAQAAGTERDAAADSFDSGAGTAEALGSLIDGGIAHLEIYADMLDKLCEVHQNGSGPGSEMTEEDCNEIKEGVGAVKDSFEELLSGISEQIQNALNINIISPEDAAEWEDVIDEGEGDAIPVCEEIDGNSWPCS